MSFLICHYEDSRIDPRPFQRGNVIVSAIDPILSSGLDYATIRFQSGIPEQQRPSHEENRGDREPDNQREYPYRNKDLVRHECHYRFPEQERENRGDDCEKAGDNLVFEREVRDHVFSANISNPAEVAKPRFRREPGGGNER